MPSLKLPGARTGVVYVWAMFLGPVLLLIAGVTFLAMGLWLDVDRVAAIGAIGMKTSTSIVASSSSSR
jgi:hypothetical protein